jgi:bifunctional polynucleotide phosphatase/kinase
MSRRNGLQQSSIMDFASSKRGHSDSTGDEPAPKKTSPDSSALTAIPRVTGGQWASVGASLLIYTCDGIKASSKIAGFDMGNFGMRALKSNFLRILDGTLIKTKSGATFPKNTTDWMLWNPKVAPKIQQLFLEGYKIVIFTNQRGIEQGKVQVRDFKNKIVNISKALRVPLQVISIKSYYLYGLFQAFVSTGHVSFRKPHVGMWVELEQNYNDGVPIDRNASIYCGDAAGRIKTSVSIQILAVLFHFCLGP